MHLAPQSAINVAYSTDRRRVHLLKGEAFFEVAPEADRHFTVETSGVDTTDLGTAFAVRLNGDGTNIAVRQGLVLVEAAPAISEKLEAGECVRVLPHGKVERGRTLPDEVAAWTRGQLIAKNRPVSEIVDQLRPYYSGYIILNGAALARQPLTGVYNLSDPVEALRAVARAQGATVREISPWLVVLSGS